MREHSHAPLSDPRRRSPGSSATGAGIALAALLAACSPQAPAPAAPPPENKPAASPAADSVYDHSLSDAEGKPQSLAQWKGKFLVLNFWATWCGPCVAEMPDLEKAQRSLASRNVVIVGVGTEEPAKVRAFRSQHGLHLNLLAGGYDALVLARSLGDNQGVLPYTVLVSPDGTVLQTQTGPLHPGQLSGWLAATP